MSDFFKLSEVIENPRWRLTIMLLGIVGTGFGVVWGVRGVMDSVLFEFRHQIETQGTQIAAQGTQLAAVISVATLLTGQVKTLSDQAAAFNSSIEAEETARKTNEVETARKLEQSERSRRAEENGLLQQINALVSRIDSMMLQLNSGVPPRRGDVTPDIPPMPPG